MQGNPYSAHAEKYDLRRPSYPRALGRYLADVAPRTDRAWDCAAGTGKATQRIKPFFRRVVASDESHAMLSRISPDDRVEKIVAPAELSHLPDASVDLVMVAAAAHWLELEAFHAVVKRSLRPGGVLACFTYFAPDLGPRLNSIVGHLVDDILGPYWKTEMLVVKQDYRTLPFPFSEFAAPSFQCQMYWGASDVLDYFETWSAAFDYAVRNEGVRSTSWIAEEFTRLWGNGGRRVVTLPLHLRIGRG